MNKFEKWASSQKVWVHLLLVIATYGIWLIVWIIVANKKYNATPAEVRFEKEFYLEDCDKYIQNINEILDIEKNNYTPFKGMKPEEIKKYGKKVYEADGFELPWPSINYEWSKEDHMKHSIMQSRNKKEDKHVNIGLIPDSVYGEIDSYRNWNVKREIHAIIKNGNYKMVDKDGKVKLHKQTPKIKVIYKIYDK